MKCLASSSNPTPARPELRCDDECLRLERNRRLAAALNIDPSSHANDHVPYSDATLRLFKENLAWAESQEREFRVFSKSPSEIRMRYKPMSAACRQFLHLLAEDYGLESRSEDIEPHRYVIVFKGPRFVSAPSKTIAQCVKIRETQAAEAAAAAAASRPPSAPLTPASDPFNGLVLTSPRFGLTVEDVSQAFALDFAAQPSIRFSVSFLPSDEVLLRATSSYSAFLTPSGMQQALASLKPRLAKTVEHTGLAGNVLLCHIGGDECVSRREDPGKKDALGWNAVAGRAAAKSGTSTPVEDAPARGGRKLLGLRKKKADREPDGRPWAALGGDVEC